MVNFFIYLKQPNNSAFELNNNPNLPSACRCIACAIADIAECYIGTMLKWKHIISFISTDFFVMHQKLLSIYCNNNNEKKLCKIFECM